VRSSITTASPPSFCGIVCAATFITRRPTSIRRLSSHPHGPARMLKSGHRSEQIRHHGILGRRGVSRSAAGLVFGFRQEEQRTPAILWPGSFAPDFAGIIYPGPFAFRAASRAPAFRQCPPAFVACGGSATACMRSGRSNIFPPCSRSERAEYECIFMALAAIPATRCRWKPPDRRLTDRNDTPWHVAMPFHRLFRDLGSAKAGVET